MLFDRKAFSSEHCSIFLGEIFSSLLRIRAVTNFFFTSKSKISNVLRDKNFAALLLEGKFDLFLEISPTFSIISSRMEITILAAFFKYEACSLQIASIDSCKKVFFF